ncbi:MULTISPECIES: hypothetical protein [unclassified Pantoea]|uniref:hypothetical protein n=1 Tax=unclassified Pantoea TaxID=2630326 RepID=UPI001232A515|nr:MULTISPECIES: hypothetical protein [unclassified Pantoea]KAA5953395.1 hypothetical protein F3I55_16325 [Pantoea sp. VH_24]KAA5964625.1 hypothetical protein F3I53_02090 [Pantoea sp. VH_16]KAA5968438.1 hypothetical protein F3I54_00420 [Pantoea sp. VH_18]KAA6004492.1 hypothetical protein F3I46_01405 [Pantoea sp. M_1]KAA6006980.1 hypothetical protein F3I45_02065 [Pantoea sp. F_7]
MEKERHIKADFDEFYSTVEPVANSLIYGEYSDTSIFIINQFWLKDKYFSYSDRLTKEDRKYLLENHLTDYFNLMTIGTIVAAISSTIEHIMKPQMNAVIY